MKNTLKEAIKKIITFFTTSSILLLANSTRVFADDESAKTTKDIADAISNGITSITDIIRNIVNPIAILAVVIIGVYLIMSENEQQKAKAKSWFISIVIGLIVINLAPTLVNTISNIGQ